MGAGPFGQIISGKVNSELRGRKNKKLLEAGCGSASYFTFDDIVKSVGIDIDDDQIEKNSLMDEKIRGDLETYPLPKDEFDIVVCWDVIEHLSRPQLALCNLFNALRPGGLIILSFPNLLSFKGLVTKLSPFWFHKAFYRLMKYTSRNFPTYLRVAILPNRVLKLAEANGFSVIYRAMGEGGLTRRVRKRFWFLNIIFLSINAVWKLLTFGRYDSLFSDSCVLIMRKSELAAGAAC